MEGILPFPVITPSAIYKEHINSVDFVCVVPSDKTKFISASHDKTAKVWDVSNNKESIGTLKGHELGLWGCAVAPTGFITATTASDGIVKLWDCKTLKLIKDLKYHSKRAYCAKFSVDGTKLLTCGGDHTVSMWDMKNLSKPEKCFNSI